MSTPETVYSAAPALRSPRRFLAAARADLRLVPSAAWLVFRRELQARYRQSRLGRAWLLVPPAAITALWLYLDHAGIVGVGDVGIPYAAYVLAGIVLWEAFADALSAPLRRLNEARHVISKARMPHEAWIAAGAIDVVFALLVRVALLAVVLVIVGAPVGWSVLLAPLGIFALLLLGLAVGLALTPVGLLYGDVAQAIRIAVTFGFFLTPIIYAWPVHGSGTWLIAHNPVTPVLVTTRAWLTGAPGAVPGELAAVGAGSLLLLVASWLVYRLAQPHLAARL